MVKNGRMARPVWCSSSAAIDRGAVSLAAMADGMGEMVWIAAGHGAGTSLVSNAVSTGAADGCPGQWQ
jgi:hypothetical protein